MKRRKGFWQWLRDEPELLVWFLLVSSTLICIVLPLWWGSFYEDPENWNGVLVELNGLTAEVVVVGFGVALGLRILRTRKWRPTWQYVQAQFLRFADDVLFEVGASAAWSNHVALFGDQVVFCHFNYTGNRDVWMGGMQELDASDFPLKVQRFEQLRDRSGMLQVLAVALVGNPLSPGKKKVSGPFFIGEEGRGVSGSHNRAIARWHWGDFGMFHVEHWRSATVCKRFNRWRLQ